MDDIRKAKTSERIEKLEVETMREFLEIYECCETQQSSASSNNRTSGTPKSLSRSNPTVDGFVSSLLKTREEITSLQTEQFKNQEQMHILLKQ